MLRNQSGQGLIEYILILVVVVGMILGGIYQMNQAAKVWAEGYFGDYLTCLLETGQLPVIGNTPDPNDPEACQREAFNFAGVTPGEGSEGSSTAGSNPDSISRGGSDGNQSGGSRPAPSGNAESASTSSSREDSQVSGTSNRFRSQAGRGGRSSDGLETETLGASAAGSYNSKSDSNQGQATRFGVPRTGRGSRESEDDRQTITMSSVSTQDGPEEKGNLIPIKKRLPDSIAEEEDEGFSFGFFLRYLIIGAIIVAIIIFIGGQVLQVSKSMD